MSSRLTRALLKLYPRRMRNRYGDELLDLQDELRAQGDVSRLRVIRDMLAGALLVRRARRTYLVPGTVLVICGFAIAGAAVGGLGADSPARGSHGGPCFVADGSSCSLTPCTEFIGEPSAQGAGAHGSLPAQQRAAPPDEQPARQCAVPRWGIQRRG